MLDESGLAAVHFSRPRRLIAAIPPLLAAAVFLYGWWRFPSPYSVHLGKLMQLEFLALPAGGFLGLPMLWKPGNLGGRLLRLLLLLGFGALYAYAGQTAMGWLGVLELSLLILTTYAGLLRPRDDPPAVRAVETVLRWIVCLFALMLLAGMLGAPTAVDTWHESRVVLLFGGVYFLLLACIEAAGFYAGMRKMGNVWHPRAGRR